MRYKSTIQAQIETSIISIVRELLAKNEVLSISNSNIFELAKILKILSSDEGSATSGEITIRFSTKEFSQDVTYGRGFILTIKKNEIELTGSDSESWLDGTRYANSYNYISKKILQEYIGFDPSSHKEVKEGIDYFENRFIDIRKIINAEPIIGNRVGERSITVHSTLGNLRFEKVINN